MRYEIIKDPLYIPPNWVTGNFIYRERWYKLKKIFDALELFYSFIYLYKILIVSFCVSMYLLWILVINGEFSIINLLIPMIVWFLGIKAQFSMNHCI